MSALCKIPINDEGWTCVLENYKRWILKDF